MKSFHTLQEENKKLPINKGKYTRPQEIKLPGETVVVGPGTVPNSIGSVSVTSIEGMAKSFRKISELGIIDAVNEEDGNRTIASAK